jgi:TetR/AcrR family transcriptional regulator, regulator of autoinduction and epiphytic fitness
MTRPAASREDPRVARTRSVVLGAAADLLAERGYAAFTMDALVERTGVSKTTMYKHWPSRTSLIAATVQALTAEPAVPDTGSIRDDLITLALASLDAYRGVRWPVLASIQEAAGHDPELRDALQPVSATRFSAVQTVLERAVQRGQLRPDLDTGTAITILVGAIFFRLRTADLPQVRHEVPVIIGTALDGLSPAVRNPENPAEEAR